MFWKKRIYNCQGMQSVMKEFLDYICGKIVSSKTTMLKRILYHDHHLRRPRKHKSLQSYYLLVRAFLYHRLTALMIGSIMLANFCHSYHYDHHCHHHYDHHCHHHHNYHPIWFSLAPSAIRWRQLPYFLITTTLGLSYGYQPICAP